MQRKTLLVYINITRRASYARKWRVVIVYTFLVYVDSDISSSRKQTITVNMYRAMYRWQRYVISSIDVLLLHN